MQKMKEMTKIAHSYGATIEAELGHVVFDESEKSDPSALYTDPQQALEFVTETGVDALAIAVGTAHGAYKLPPKLDFERIRTIANTVDIPLVLHGGSGLTDDDFRRAIQEGISKVNIFTDIVTAAAKAAYDSYNDGARILTDMQPKMVEAIKEATIKKMNVFKNR